jgi:hypothetical protein
MGLEDTYNFFKYNNIDTIFGEATPYFTITQIMKGTKKSNTSVRKDIKLLLNKNIIADHPLNDCFKTKKYRLM